MDHDVNCEYKFYFTVSISTINHSDRKIHAYQLPKTTMGCSMTSIERYDRFKLQLGILFLGYFKWDNSTQSKARLKFPLLGFKMASEYRLLSESHAIRADNVFFVSRRNQTRFQCRSKSLQQSKIEFKLCCRSSWIRSGGWPKVSEIWRTLWCLFKHYCGSSHQNPTHILLSSIHDTSFHIHELDLRCFISSFQKFGRSQLKNFQHKKAHNYVMIKVKP